ncbi:MAG: hypothetical protein ACRDDY_17725 [Clostridium sp.]|uniref:hypothetical protein n=1 Tax=Clostridium sp. TaxID=1506 RepID=UPI003EE7B7C3
MRKLIKDMDYLELYNFINDNKYITEDQLTQIERHKNVDDVEFYGKGNYSIMILKDNGNIFDCLDIIVNNELYELTRIIGCRGEDFTIPYKYYK